MAFLILGLAVFLILVNAVFVAAEFALVASRSSRLEELAEGGSKSAKASLLARKDLRRQISGSQLGITLSSVLLGIISEPSIGSLISSLLQSLGVPEGAGKSISWICALGIAAMLQMMFGEIIPKNLAIADPERTLGLVMPVQKVFVYLTQPLIWMLDQLAILLLKPFTHKIEIGEKDTLGIAELSAVVAASKEDGLIEVFEHDLLTSALDLGKRQVTSVMIPASEMTVVNRKLELSMIEEKIVLSGHSRIPVIGHNSDDLLGFLHAKDLLRLPAEAQNEPVPLEMLRRMLVVRPNLLLDDLLLQMRRSRSHLAGVKDENGKLLGLIALEDVIEELVGEIEDESDRVIV